MFGCDLRRGKGLSQNGIPESSPCNATIIHLWVETMEERFVHSMCHLRDVETQHGEIQAVNFIGQK